MSNAIGVEEQLPERLTWAQICKRYPDEWVAMVETKWVKGAAFKRGTKLVLGHYKARQEATPRVKAAFEHSREVGWFWTGELVPRVVLP